MYEEDQKARFEVINSGQLDSEERARAMEKIDREHLPRLKAIIEKFGWPGIRVIGEKGVDTMWLLVQHCDRDIDFQKLCIQLLKNAVSQGEAHKRHLAYLTDRVLVNERKSQIYGTQVQIIEGQIILLPIEDPGHLDKRREEMELESFAEYLSLLKKVYHLEK
jgi:hypothetical protein